LTADEILARQSESATPSATPEYRNKKFYQKLVGLPEAVRNIAGVLFDPPRGWLFHARWRRQGTVRGRMLARQTLAVERLPGVRRQKRRLEHFTFQHDAISIASFPIPIYCAYEQYLMNPEFSIARQMQPMTNIVQLRQPWPSAFRSAPVFGATFTAASGRRACSHRPSPSRWLPKSAISELVSSQLTAGSALIRRLAAPICQTNQHGLVDGRDCFDPPPLTTRS
jgi:hypothetical protein